MALSVDLKRAKTILVLGGPIVIAMFTQTFINVVDTIFVGKLDPSYATPGQAALGFSLPILWSLAGFLAAIGIGTQAMTARRIGSQKPEEAGIVLTNSIVVAIIGSLIFTVLGWFIVPPFFEFLTRNQNVLNLGIPYAQIRVLGILGMVLTTSYKGFFDGIGSTRVHMYAALVMNAANIGLNYIFIFGWGPIPAMYVTGAAVASLLSTFIGLVMMVVWSLRGKYRKPHRYYRPRTLNPKLMWEIVKLSVPSGAAQLFVMSGVLMFLKIIGMLDETAVEQTLRVNDFYAALPEWMQWQEAIRTATATTGTLFVTDWNFALISGRPPVYTTAAKLVIDLLSIGFVMCIAFGTATATLVSKSMGEKRFDLAEAYGWDSVKIGSYFFGAIGLIIILQPAFFLDLLTDDPQVINAAIPGLRIMAGLEIFIAMALILTQALFGAGNTRFVMWIELILHGLCLAPLTYLFGVVLDFGFLGVWLSATIYVMALAVAMAWKFWEGSWKEIEV